VYPGKHRHAVIDLDDAGAMEFSGHFAHGPPSGPVKSGRHLQLVEAFEPFGAAAFGTQDVQFPFPTKFLKVFTGQRSQKSTFKL
jgi:hypothetical protein